MLQVVYTGETPPSSYSKSIFLAGPTPRSKKVRSWRPHALKILQKKKYNGVVFVPEDRSGSFRLDYTDQVNWEHACLDMADCILFWVPRNLKTMPAFTTNIEYGLHANAGKVVFGAPPKAPKNRYLKFTGADKYFIPQAETLEHTIDNALKFIGDGAKRSGGEREVPLHVWRTFSFQRWYQAQKRAGHRLDNARVEFTIRKGLKKEFIFIWGLIPNIFIPEENRHKCNDPVISRPDISSVVAYKRTENILDSEIVLVKEFRSSASTHDGFIWELPSGSSLNPELSPTEVGSEELLEETGKKIPPSRFTVHEARQLAGTLSAHQAHALSVELADEELLWFKQQKGIIHGVSHEGETGERTYVEVRTLKEILNERLVDWTNVGIILSVLHT